MTTASFNDLLAWTRLHMPRVRRAIADMPDMSGIRLACSLHIEIKMVPVLEAVMERGASLYVLTCNPSTVRDAVVEHLRRKGAIVDAWCAMPEEAYRAAIKHALDWRPTHLCEMGADLTSTYHQRREEDLPIVAGLEATGTGITRLNHVAPRYPIYNWDDIPIKEGLHNRHMVGITAWHTFYNVTHMTLHEKRVLVVGYGPVGRGVAEAARAYGGSVTIAERDPARMIEAAYDGWPVSSLDEAIAQSDVIVTATGVVGVINQAHFGQLKDGAFLLNVGHINTEIDVETLRSYPHAQMLPHVESFSIGSRTVYLIAGGGMMNLTAGEGDSFNAFDVTLAIMVRGLTFLATQGAEAPPGLYMLPAHVWARAMER